MNSTWIHIAVDFNGNYGRGLMRGAAAYALEHPGWRLIPQALESFEPRQASDAKLGGLLIQAATPRLRDMAAAKGVPVVNVSGALTESPFPRVANDDHAIGRMAAEHFLHLHVPMCAWSGVGNFQMSDDRRAGFVDALTESGIPWVDLPGQPAHHRGEILDLLSSSPRPVGLFCMNDIRARTLFVHLTEWGFRIPEDVALLGVDNDDLSAWISGIGLSSVKPDAQRIGYLAAHTLHRMMEGEEIDPDLRLPPLGVEIRGSTDTVGVEDPALRQGLLFIRAHSVEGIGVEDVAREAGVSRRILEMRFRATLDRSVGQEIKRTRLAHGAVLLRESDLCVDEIAEACGYSEASPFSNAFRKEYGQSPRAFRNEARLQPP